METKKEFKVGEKVYDERFGWGDNYRGFISYKHIVQNKTF